MQKKKSNEAYLEKTAKCAVQLFSGIEILDTLLSEFP